MALYATVKDLQPGGASWQVALPEPLATIGRNATCDLVLQDPDKHVSRLHATIELRQEVHYLTVNSTINPILVDGAACPPNTTVVLRDGACIAMHPFEVTVRIERARPARNPGAASFSWLDGDRQAAPAAPDADPFGLNYLNAGTRQAPAASEPDPFQRAPPPPSSALVPGMFDAGENRLGAPASLDPLALLGGAPASLGHPGAARSQPMSLDSLLGSSGSGGVNAPLVDFGGHLRQTGSSALDHVHDVDLPFRAPPVPAAPAPPVFGATDSGLDWLDAFTPAVPPAHAEPPAVAVAFEPSTAPAVAPAPDSAAAVQAPDSAAAVQAFLRGLGDAGFTVAPGQQAEFFEKAGEVVQVAVQGLVTLLLARGEIKKELRAEERTMLASRANNPLKFMGSSQEALRFLFDPGAVNAGAFLAPAKAIEDACNELVAHELGLVAGMRAAVIGAINRFDPDALEQRAGKVGGLIPMRRKARLWEMYVEQYGQLQRDMADNLDRLFERDFLLAYTEQVRRMSQK